MRKSVFATFTAAVAVAAALLLTGCERAIDMTGKPVSFSAVAMDYAAGTRSDLPDTRVVYGDITGTNTQAIEWIKGDLITIHSPQCTRIQSDGDEHTCEYIVTEVHPDNASEAGIGLPYYIAEGLQWNGEGVYTFYALYPGKDTEGMTGNAIVAAGEHVTATGTIPQIQDGTASTDSETGNTDIAPDMRNMYMTAKTQVDAAWSNVVLEFKPLTTVLEFTIKKEDSDSVMDISSVSLTSAAHALSGGFKVNMDVNGKYTTTGTSWCTEGSGRPETTLASATPSEADRKVTINFGSPVKLAKGQSLTFTFFLNPGNDVDDLTFSISGTVGKESEKKESFNRKTALKTSTGTGVAFHTHQKTRLTGLMLPDAIAWTVNYDPTVDPWNASGPDNDPMPEVGGKTFVTSWDTGEEEDLNFSKESDPIKWVDLGLPSGNLWADRNVGAKSETDAGQHFAYGENAGYGEPASSYGTWQGAKNETYLTITNKTNFNKDYYKWYGGAKFNRYAFNVDGFVSTLVEEDDPASVKIGNGAVSPTGSDWKELFDNCTVAASAGGITVSSKTNSYSIFIPYNGWYNEGALTDAGKGYYWTSEMDQKDEGVGAGMEEKTFAKSSQISGTVLTSSPIKRYYGLGVRAVKHVHKSVKIGDVYWATTNIGANTPNDYGWYFFWGGTEGYTHNGSNWVKASDNTSVLSGGFCWANTPFNNGNSNFDRTYFDGVRSTVCPDDVLAKGYDAASVIWGGSWRMPTSAEFNAMKGSTYWAWDTTDKGYYVFAPDKNHKAGSINNSIPSDLNKASALLFFPIAGHGSANSLTNMGSLGYYWSSTFDKDNANLQQANSLYFTNSAVYSTYGRSRNCGFSVRPVHD